MGKQLNQIISNVVQDDSMMPVCAGLASAIAALFADAALELPITE